MDCDADCAKNRDMFIKIFTYYRWPLLICRAIKLLFKNLKWNIRIVDMTFVL